jgi:hypothetical protein
MIRRLSLATALLMLCLFAAPQPASAYNPFKGVNCGGDNASSAVCSSHQAVNAAGQPISPIVDILTHITNIVAFAAGAAAIIIIIISALKLIGSGSDVSTGSRTDTDVEDARRSIAGAVIGLAVIVLARTLILFVLKKV